MTPRDVYAAMLAAHDDGLPLPFRASGSATVEASGSATVRAFGSATVEASGSATVRAFGSVTEAYGSATWLGMRLALLGHRPIAADPAVWGDYADEYRKSTAGGDGW